MVRMHTEAAAACKREKFMCKYMHRHVLDHASWPAMLSHILAAKIADSEVVVYTTHLWTVSATVTAHTDFDRQLMHHLTLAYLT